MKKKATNSVSCVCLSCSRLCVYLDQTCSVFIGPMLWRVHLVQRTSQIEAMLEGFWGTFELSLRQGFMGHVGPSEVPIWLGQGPFSYKNKVNTWQQNKFFPTKVKKWSNRMSPVSQHRLHDYMTCGKNGSGMDLTQPKMVIILSSIQINIASILALH